MSEIYQVVAPLTREELATKRANSGLEPATFNYSDPTTEMHLDPLWNAIWHEMKTWDINVPTEYAGYSGATGNHVTAIYLAIQEYVDIKKMNLKDGDVLFVDADAVDALALVKSFPVDTGRVSVVPVAVPYGKTLNECVAKQSA